MSGNSTVERALLHPRRRPRHVGVPGCRLPAVGCRLPQLEQAGNSMGVPDLPRAEVLLYRGQELISGHSGTPVSMAMRWNGVASAPSRRVMTSTGKASCSSSVILMRARCRRLML